MATSVYLTNPFGGGGGGGTPGGSDTQIQYNNAGAFGGVAGFTWNGSALAIPGPVTLTGAAGSSALTIAGGAQTASFPALSLTQTWNNAAVTFSGITFNVTNTASANGSKFLDVQVAGSTAFSVTRESGAGNYRATVWGGTVNDFTRVGSAGLDIGTNAVGILFSINESVTSGAVVQVGALGGMTWRSTNRVDSGSVDVAVWRDAAATLALRNGVDAQEFRPYGYYSSATSRAYGVVKSVKEAVTLTGATTSTASIIPAGSFVIGVATTTTTTITGASGYTVGDGADADRWGDVTGTAVGTDTDNTNATANPTGYVAAASAVTLTAKTSNFTGGVVQVVVFYLTTGAD